MNELHLGTGETTQARPPTLNPYHGVRIKLLFAVGAQLILLVGLAAPHAYTLTTGKVAVMRAMPIDPYDPFRGEYLSLAYQDMTEVETDQRFLAGEPVYVLANSSGDHLTAIRLLKTVPKPEPGETVIKGKIRWCYQRKEKMVTVIDYGLSRIYMPAGRSGQIQGKGAKTTVEVAIDRSGNACIKRAFVDGRMVYDGTSMLNPFH